MLKQRRKGPGTLEPPKSERLRRIASALAAGMNGREASLKAGYPNTERTRRGIYASEAKRDPWVRAQIEQGREAFREACFVALADVRAALGVQKLPRGKRPALSKRQAIDHALARHILQVAGLLAPDTTPPPTASALADALLGSIPAEKLGPLLYRAAEAVKKGGRR